MEATALSKTMHRLVLLYGDSFWGDDVFRDKDQSIGRKRKLNGPVFQDNSIFLL